jgi:hypothetical protein
MQNAIKLENISNLITPSSYYLWPTHINGMYVRVLPTLPLGIPKVKFSKQMKTKYLVTEL